MFPFGFAVGFVAGAAAAAAFAPQLTRQARPTAKAALKVALTALHEVQVRGAQTVEAAEDLYAEAEAEVSEEILQAAAANDTVSGDERPESRAHEAKLRNKPARSKPHRSTGRWAADIKKYVPDADFNAVAGIMRHCGIALQSRDASLVAFSNRAELDRVRDKFLRKKLGLTQTDEELNEAIRAVGDKMKGVKAKNRVTVYYLLADHFGKLSLFT